ncbi:hypothetical protein B9H04_12990 [Halorubrum ezzemoulense DSM 17463]|uniref:Sugar-specific transcriptional regulator TrmB n=1 Tax=Halorubrum ezzemoulense DSM 17463 TaxID=1121945 RepID=A0A1X4GJW5_HALEZ|nr:MULTISPECIES: hypothetical protein [Halorubrum]MDB2272455.1 hypothetical protein [Halorubrum ezzemoulense]MDB9281505.1 hypothetical protein [Halorubrum ezzemoulense]MDB9285035.1 hypothetical protein [Halorubrum ezzemoulense]OSO97489.1 hypothetical protein B9H04_12990 [Halorubrum ezzemoulense DSM 17463]TKX35657.1 hypothetical protein EXE52_17850 [Halorubrum sp. CGM4_25_10-8A]
MEDPGSDIQADTDERAPNFDALTPPEEVVRGDRTRDDFFDAVLGLADPATAGDVAERAGHGVDAAREYLDWFERMGIVTKVTDSPATYERNQEYLNWRRVQTLRRQYTTEELLDLLQSESERADALAAEFAAESPASVSITRYAAASDQSIEAVWEQLSAWETALRRVSLLERALTPTSGEATDRESAV